MAEAKKNDRFFGLPVILLLGALVIGIPLVLLMTRPENEHPHLVGGIVNNLRLLEGAKEQWALENKKDPGATPTLADVAPYLKNGVMPSPVAGETYLLNPVGTRPTAKLATPGGRFRAGSVVDADSFK